MLIQVKSWFEEDLRVIEVMSWRNELRKLNEVFSDYGFNMNSDLHAHFDDFMDVFSKNSKNESCLSLGLVCSYKNSALLE